MRDFFEALIERAGEKEDGLAPRTPAMFEPIPIDYGPRGGPGVVPAFDVADAETPIEGHRVVGKMPPSVERRDRSATPSAARDLDQAQHLRETPTSIEHSTDDRSARTRSARPEPFPIVPRGHPAPPVRMETTRSPEPPPVLTAASPPVRT